MKKAIQMIKRLLPFLFVIMAYSLSSQTTFSGKIGINWGSVHSNQGGGNNYLGYYNTYPSYCFGIDLKHKFLKRLKIGGAVEYYLNNFHWYSHYGGAGMFDGFDVNYKIGYLRFTIFPELILGNKLQIHLILGPYFSIMTNSYMDGSFWGYPYAGFDNTKHVNGSAGNYIKSTDTGLEGTIGIGYKVKPNLLIAIDFSGNLGLLNISKVAGDVRTSGFVIYAKVEYDFPANKEKNNK